MTKHPLTDKLCYQIVCSTPPLPRDQQNRVLSYDGRILDGMYEIRVQWYESQKHEMRAAADWQLEKCDDELGNILHCLAIAGKITEEERIQIYVLFKEAMRPTNATNTGGQLDVTVTKDHIHTGNSANDLQTLQTK